jgi:hypothetical protein
MEKEDRETQRRGDKDWEMYKLRERERAEEWEKKIEMWEKDWEIKRCVRGERYREAREMKKHSRKKDQERNHNTWYYFS